MYTRSVPNFLSSFCGQSDRSMLEFLQYQDQTSQYYSDLMNKLERMNGTLGSMLHYLDNMQTRVEERLHMIQGYLGWAGDTCWAEACKRIFHKTQNYRCFHGLVCFPVCLFFVITGLSLTAMWTCIAHTGYFLVCAVLLTFLRCPAFSRAVLLLSVPLNAVAEVNRQPALDLTGLSLLLLTLSLGTKLRFLSRKLSCSPVNLLYLSLPYFLILCLKDTGL